MHKINSCFLLEQFLSLSLPKPLSLSSIWLLHRPPYLHLPPPPPPHHHLHLADAVTVAGLETKTLSRSARKVAAAARTRNDVASATRLTVTLRRTTITGVPLLSVSQIQVSIHLSILSVYCDLCNVLLTLGSVYIH